ncbi:MAG TPA: hypothetical protein ENH31_00475 [Nitrospirae bacterium]|nr:hypothetical protein [Nitrospirota bacterium]
MIVRQYRVLKDLPMGFYGAFFANAPAYFGAGYEGTIKAGEICTYAEDNKKYRNADVYLFGPKDNIFVFVRRTIVERWDAYFEPIDPEPRQVQGEGAR